MPSSLFGQPMPQPQANNNNIVNAINQIKSAAQGNPQALFNNMMQSNPQFRAFAESVKDKTPEQAFSERGLDFNQIRGLFR